MKTRIKTKFGMCSKEPKSEGYFSLVFDKPVALNGHLKTKTWLVSFEKLKAIL